MEGQSPAVASEHAETVDESVRCTARLLGRIVDSQQGRLSNNTVRRHTGTGATGETPNASGTRLRSELGETLDHTETDVRGLKAKAP